MRVYKNFSIAGLSYYEALFVMGQIKLGYIPKKTATTLSLQF